VCPECFHCVQHYEHTRLKGKGFSAEMQVNDSKVINKVRSPNALRQRGAIAKDKGAQGDLRSEVNL
jgi:hypothetical protein